MFRFPLTAALISSILTAPAYAEGDPARGEREFRRCAACHQVGPEAKSRVGPILNGIVGAAAGQEVDYNYSDAMAEKVAEGLIWDEANLTAFLTKPRDFMPGTKMSFAGLRRDTEIADLIAYLATQN